MEISLSDLKELFGTTTPPAGFDNGMIGKYVVVRCRDAGVHAGVLKVHSGREALLEESRRLYYWKCEGKAQFLSGVATAGITNASKVGRPITVHLTETCEIIKCTEAAEASIREKDNYSE